MYCAHCFSVNSGRCILNQWRWWKYQAHISLNYPIQGLSYIFDTVKNWLCLLLSGKSGVLSADRSGPVACGHVQRHTVPAWTAGPGRTGDGHHAKNPGDHHLISESCLPGQSAHTHSHTHTYTLLHTHFDTQSLWDSELKWDFIISIVSLQLNKE